MSLHQVIRCDQCGYVEATTDPVPLGWLSVQTRSVMAPALPPKGVDLCSYGCAHEWLAVRREKSDDGVIASVRDRQPNQPEDTQSSSRSDQEIALEAALGRMASSEQRYIHREDKPPRRANRRITNPVGRASESISFECPDCGDVLKWCVPAAGGRAFCPNPNCGSYETVFECDDVEDRVRELKARMAELDS